MAEQSRLFLGLVQPPKLVGLPIMYAMVWLFGTVLIFLWVQHWTLIPIGIAAYGALWKLADWDPHFLDVVATTMQETPPTKNRSVHGGDSYAP